MDAKHLKQWLLPFVVLALLIVTFVVAFFTNELIFFILSALLIVLFIVLYSINNKKIVCEYGYSPMQAYNFFKDCKLKNVTRFSGKINENQKEILDAILDKYEFAKDYNAKELKSLYDNGYQISLFFEKIIKTNNK